MSYNFKRIVSIFVLSLEDFKPVIRGPETVGHVALRQQFAGVLVLHVRLSRMSLT